MIILKIHFLYRNCFASIGLECIKIVFGKTVLIDFGLCFFLNNQFIGGGVLYALEVLLRFRTMLLEKKKEIFIPPTNLICKYHFFSYQNCYF